MAAASGRRPFRGIRRIHPLKRRKQRSPSAAAAPMVCHVH
ncbi:Uncharacterized protein ToN1_21730 [Aromatoleum petrolei]|nr:Uncharacterized protein ToN1_21730 [Aromatoleum petrolei]